MEKHTEQPRGMPVRAGGGNKRNIKKVYTMCCGPLVARLLCVRDGVHAFFQVCCRMIYKTEIPFSIGDPYSLAHARIYAQAEFALREFHHDPIDTEYSHEYSGFGRMYVRVRISVVGLGVRPCEGE